MKYKYSLSIFKVLLIMNRLFIYIIFSLLIIFSYTAYSAVPSNGNPFLIRNSELHLLFQPNNPDLKIINSRLRKLFDSNRIGEAQNTIDSVRFFLGHGIKADSTVLSDANYFVGTYYLNFESSALALVYLKEAANILEKAGKILNTTYSNSLYNVGRAYLNLGDFSQSLHYFEASLENDKLLTGDKSITLISLYIGLAVINIYIRDYEKALEWANQGLKIAQPSPDSVKPEILASLYGTRGVIYSWLANWEQAKYNLEKAESYYNNINVKGINYINLLDNLGTTYHFLGLKEKSYYYYEKGVKLITNDFSNSAFNVVNNYAIILGNDSLEKKGEFLLSDFLKKIKFSPGNDQRYYYLILRNYADYLREYKIDETLAIKIYLQCFNYLKTHPWDNDYRDNIILGYSLSLFQNGKNRMALDSIQTLLFPDKSAEALKDSLKNPVPIKADGRSLKILKTKYQILWSEYWKTNNITTLVAAAQTSELIIEVLEKIRLSIGEEGSRLLLGDKYRNSYMDAIKCLNECYSKTKNQQYLEKAFKCSEKSKVASLLASTREMKAIQIHIPSVQAKKEKELEWNIGFYSSTIADEENKEKPDLRKISLWKDYLLTSTESKDSLIKVFERSYPEYYALKYDSKVIGLEEMPGIIGSSKTFLSYIVSDSLLYIFISNSKCRQLITLKIDPSFFETVSGFRNILNSPDLDEKASDEFKIFQIYGYKLYSYLIEPIKKYLNSNDLIISPDDILSFLPFETFLTSKSVNVDLIYRKLPYLMNDYNISYAYSATLLSENGRVKPSFRNKAIVFSPTYKTPINIDSVATERQSFGRILRALPSARDEAEYVTGITHGTLFSDTSATESNYKKKAGDFDIIHLAMHAYIDIQNPILSRLFFSKLSDDGPYYGLNAFEVYAISLKAKMVVLSSCNTGAGNLKRGEGILSLARGFIYSGSKSVIMSLWEVDDKSGTDIVKSFYMYLKSGYSKSEALRKARMKYLKSAGTLRSFPYFWSTLVVYGDDSPIYISSITKIIIALIACILIFGAFIYFKRR
jgi:CHAT domain-containing protein